MEAAYRLNVTELPDFMKALKALFKKEAVLEVTVNTIPKNSLAYKETREEYFARIDQSIKDLDERKNVVSFTGEEFEKHFKARLAKHGRKI